MPRPHHSSGQLSRRALIGYGLWGLGLAALRPSHLRADAPYTVTRVWLRYRTDRERIARVLPPPLKPDDKAEVWVEYALATLPEASAATLVLPASYGWAGMFVTARHGEEPGLFPVGLWSSDEWGRLNGREFLGLNVKHGDVSVEVKGNTVQASVRRYEKVLHRLETEIAEDPAGAFAEAPERPRAVFAYHYRLHPDWTQGPLGDQPVELMQVGGEADAARAESAQASAETAKAANDSPQIANVRGCAKDRTVFQWSQATPLDPAIEFPLDEILAVGIEQHTAAGSSLINPRESRAPHPLAKVTPKDFEPWALLNYDRPVTNETPWRPQGWRESATAYRLSQEELENYRKRPELHLGSVNVVDIQLVTEREAFVEAMPPQFQPGLRLRLLALRVGESDLTPSPFNEAWLLAYGVLDNMPLWFALSHIVGAGGDLTFGRETFGYPSKLGDIDVVTTPVDFNVLGRRNGRDFFYTEGSFEGFSTGTSLAEMDIACLRAGPFGAADPRGEFITQKWYFQGTRSFVNRQSHVMELPGEEAALGRSDPWFEFNPFRVISVTVMQNGGMQRMPGTVVAQSGGIAPYYKERCDGVLPGKDPAADSSTPGFRIKSGVTTRSSLAAGLI